MKPGCLAQHCGKESARAVLDPNFYKDSACEVKCMHMFDKDHTREKLHYQNCTTTCAVTYESEAGDAFLSCAMNNGCVEFPKIPGHCNYNHSMIQEGITLSALQGEWWQHRGKNALWDCYDCQHIHEMKLVDDAEFCAKTVNAHGPVKAPCWSYTYSYDLYLATGGTKTFQQTWQLPSSTPAGNRIDIYYNYMGSWHNESWYILQATDKYVILGDCSYMMDWINVGSIVWVRPGHNLTDEENNAIREQYQTKLGWNYDDFCYDKHGDDNSGRICRNPSTSDTAVSTPRPKIYTHAIPGHKRPVLTLDQFEELREKIGLNHISV